MTVTWADSVCLHRSLDERSRESRKTKVDKASSGFVDILKVKVENAHIPVIEAHLLEDA